ncbi:MAG: cytochrome-c peroxidase, partial [Alphaproteobacteria bacterium]|nr:cytochrome-c peroxidase [Alphaproteobacteria bacterium]
MLLLLLACADAPVDSAAFDPGLGAAELRRALSMSPRPEIPADPTNAWADDPAAARLGQALFYDARLSGNGEVSCSSCHQPEHGFADPLALSEGVGTTGRNAPHALDTAWNRWFFWDGRADSHWAQALGPMESAVEHGGSRLQYAHVVYDDPELAAAYTAVFGPLPALDDAERFPAAGRPVPEQPSHPWNVAWEGMAEADQDAVTEVFVRMGKAIAAYERLLITGPAPIDAYVEALEAEDSAGLEVLSPPARRGLALFVGDAGCHFCHAGAGFSDLEFHNIGLPDDGGAIDPGRYEGIGLLLENEFNGASRWSDDPEAGGATLEHLVQGTETLGQFKTPGLRAVAWTAPFMQDGRFETLREVVEHYN